MVAFKDCFCPAGSAHYELAKPGTMHLLPPEDYLPDLRADYEHMKNMIYGEKPEYEEVLSAIQLLEKEIDTLS